MKDILDKLIDSLNNGNLLLAVVIISVALVFNYKKIIEFFEERKKAKLKSLTDALSCEHVSGATKEHLINEVEAEHFKVATGVSLEREFREAVINAHKNAKGNLSFLVFKRALPHLKFQDSELSIKITRFELCAYWFNLIFGFIMAISGLVLMVLPSQIPGANITQSLSLFGMGVFFILVAMFMLSETFPVRSARYIEAELKKHHNNSSQSDAQSACAAA